MNRLFRNILSLALLFAPLGVVAQSYMDNPMVRVAMAAYAAQIEENPNDYSAYYNRGKDYYRYGEKELALKDLDKAIELFPRKEASDLSQAYTLRGLILQGKGEKIGALNDFNEALQLDPSSRYSLIGRGDLLYDMGEYNSARRDYEMLLRRDARCQEAYLGLARIAHRENNMGLCEDYLVKAETANPTNPDFYLQRGRFNEERGAWQSAADDYVRVLFVSANNRMAIARINNLADIAYPQVITALSNAIDKTDDKGFFYFLRALIHKNHKHYSASINDWNTILNEKYFYSHSIFYNRGYCYFHLGRFEYAADDFNNAIGLQGDIPAYYIMRSRLYRITGEYDKAAADLSMAATFNLTDVDMLQQSGLLAAEQGDYEKALSCYNEAVINNADEPCTYILRAALYEAQGNTEAAANNYTMVASMPESQPSVYSLRGFALARLGRIDEAKAWIESILHPADGAASADDNYYAACLYAQIGDKAAALSSLQAAFEQGYGDYYNIYFENDSPISLEPLRADTDFRTLVQQYNSVF